MQDGAQPRDWSCLQMMHDEPMACLRFARSIRSGSSACRQAHHHPGPEVALPGVVWSVTAHLLHVQAHHAWSAALPSGAAAPRF